VIDKAKMKQGETHNYCATATGGPFRVVLVWYDFPGDPAAGEHFCVTFEVALRQFNALTRLYKNRIPTFTQGKADEHILL
jgi:hypothetical protein